MAHLQPFTAWRYNLKHPALQQARERLWVPMLDKHEPEALAMYYQHPASAMHLGWPRGTQEALATWQRWMADKVVEQDPLPALYPYYQTYSLYGQHSLHVRKGFIALVRLDDGAILEHEDVIPQAIDQQAEVLDALQLNVTPTHAFYHDPGFVIEELMDSYMQRPLAETVDAQGVRHSLGMLQYLPHQQEIQKLIGPQQLVLADGHHRYVTSLRMRDMHPENPWYNYHLMYLSNAAADELRIFPTHRLVRLPQALSLEELKKRLAPYFELKAFDSRSPLMDEMQGKGCFAMVYGKARYLLQLKAGIEPERDILMPLHASVKRLDYTVLHYFILDRALGMPYEQQPAMDNIAYLRDRTQVIARAEQEPASLGLIVNEVSYPELQAVSQAGGRMPQKSTYFFPKVLTGLLYASLDAQHYTHAAYSSL